MFERFTAPARAIVIDSQAVARRLRHERVGTEHLLLAILASRTAASDVLRSAGLTPEAAEADLLALIGPPPAERDRAALAMLGIDVDRVREAVEATFGQGALSMSRPDRRRRRRRWRWMGSRRPDGRPGGGRHRPFSPRAKKILELSLREALHLNHRFTPRSTSRSASSARAKVSPASCSPAGASRSSPCAGRSKPRSALRRSTPGPRDACT